MNNKSFYEKRKRFGGRDKERVIWFFSEAIAKKGKAIDVFLSEPMSLETIYDSLSKKYNYSESELRDKPDLTVELMRQYTHGLPMLYPQELDAKASPSKIEE